jgi:hypothetical protein
MQTNLLFIVYLYHHTDQYSSVTRRNKKRKHSTTQHTPGILVTVVEQDDRSQQIKTAAGWSEDRTAEPSFSFV